MERNHRKKEGSSNKITIIFIVLSVILLVIGLLLFKSKRDLKTKMLQEKNILLGDFEELKNKYGELNESSQLLENDLEASRGKIIMYMDSLQNYRLSVRSMLRFKNELINLRKKTSYIMMLNDSLLRVTTILKDQNKMLTNQLSSQTNISDSLISLHNSLKKTIKKAVTLNITKAHIDAVKEKRNGKLYIHKKAKKIDMIRVCFTVEKNNYAKSGDRMFYIKVENPDGEIMGANKKIHVGGKKKKEVTYSIVTSFYYKNDSAIDICDFLKKPDENDFMPGKYVIVLFDTELNRVGEYSILMD